MICCVYVCVVVEGMYRNKNGHFDNNVLFFCLYGCREYVQMQDWEFWKQAFVFTFVLL